MEAEKRIFKTIFIAMTSLLMLVVLRAAGQPQGYTLVYSPPRAYGVDWMEIKAVYVKTEGNRLYFYIEYYGAIPNSRDYKRWLGIYMDTDRNSQTGSSYKGLGLDYEIYLSTYGDGSNFVVLYKWDSTTRSWKKLDSSLGATRAPGLSYVEVWVDQRDIGYTPQGMGFYVEAGSDVTLIPEIDLSYVVGSSVRRITVDGEAGDWSTVTPLATFPSRSINPPEFEASSIYVANDEENLYLRFDTRGIPTKAINDGMLGRRFYVYLDTDDNDATGYYGYGGAEYYIVMDFYTQPWGKSTYVDFYRYAGTGSDYRWERLSLPYSSDFNNVFELGIPLSSFGMGSGRRVGLLICGEGGFLRDTPVLAYPSALPPDTTPPATTMAIGSPQYLSDATTFVSGSTAFELSASDDASGVREIKYRVDGGSWNTYKSAFTLSAFPDGQHTISYFSSDNAGNDEAEKTVTVILDKTPPVISGASPTGSLILGSTSVGFTVRVEDTGSGVKEVRLTVDGVSQGAMSRDGETYTKTVSLSEGSHTWSIEAVDNLDNAEAWRGSFTLAVDTAPPTVSDLSAPLNPVFGEQITVTCTVSDELSGVEEVTLYYSTDGGASWTEVAMTLQAGRYVGTIPSQTPFTNVQYYVEAVDRAGNRHQTPVSTLSVGIPLWIFIATMAIIIIIIVAVLMLRRRRLPPPPPPPPPA